MASWQFTLEPVRVTGDGLVAFRAVHEAELNVNTGVTGRSYDQSAKVKANDEVFFPSEEWEASFGTWDEEPNSLPPIPFTILKCAPDQPTRVLYSKVTPRVVQLLRQAGLVSQQLPHGIPKTIPTAGAIHEGGTPHPCVRTNIPPNTAVLWKDNDLGNILNLHGAHLHGFFNGYVMDPEAFGMFLPKKLPKPKKAKPKSSMSGGALLAATAVLGASWAGYKAGGVVAHASKLDRVRQGKGDFTRRDMTTVLELTRGQVPAQVVDRGRSATVRWIQRHPQSSVKPVAAYSRLRGRVNETCFASRKAWVETFPHAREILFTDAKTGKARSPKQVCALARGPYGKALLGV